MLSIIKACVAATAFTFISVPTDAFVVNTAQRKGSNTLLKVVSTDVPTINLRPTSAITQSQISSTASVSRANSLDAAASNWISQKSSNGAYLDLGEKKVVQKNEAVEKKKATFNVIFWGGGFVAPFLATFFYFGFRFWEK
mmetsp:Transcript_26576/g.61196  ORF Transcript_26576/g.61196 Transcript_26576/m.61196 type:complete len:140 (-) Transcript_26576:827-1246(-)